MNNTKFHMCQALRWSRRALTASASGNKLAALNFTGNAFRELGVAYVGPRPRYNTPRGFLLRLGQVSDLVDQAARRALL